MALLVGELERNGEGRSDAKRTFQLADVEAHRLAFRHGELDLVGGEIPPVERSASRVAQTNLKVWIVIAIIISPIYTMEVAREREQKFPQTQSMHYTDVNTEKMY